AVVCPGPRGRGVRLRGRRCAAAVCSSSWWDIPSRLVSSSSRAAGSSGLGTASTRGVGEGDVVVREPPVLFSGWGRGVGGALAVGGPRSGGRARAARRRGARRRAGPGAVCLGAAGVVELLVVLGLGDIPSGVSCSSSAARGISARTARRR